MEKSRVIYLTEKYLAQNATPAELEEFFEIVRNNRQDDETIKEVLAQGWLKFTTTEELPADKADGIFNAILQQAEGLVEPPPARIVFMKRWKRMAAAVAILALGTTALLVVNRSRKHDLVENNRQPNQDLPAPTKSRAVITLANGENVYIDSAANGNIASQGTVKVDKLPNGQILYSGRGTGSEKSPLYNTLYNPRGSKIVNMVLDDGSQVWLNAGSSLKYPVAFSGSERLVVVTGEVYFEVAPDKRMPFKVISRGTEVTVLGTHFNMNSYDEEPGTKVTLLEGSVKVLHKNVSDNMQILLPGQQAQVNNNGEIQLIPKADIEETMAWKNGKFIFNGSDLQSVMLQLEKWYDIDVEYRGTPTDEEFVGVISRNSSLSQILSMLEQTRAVTFEIKGRKVIVK